MKKEVKRKPFGQEFSLSSELIGREVWIVMGVSESGDHYGPWIFSGKPSEEKLREICRERCDWSDGEGPGDFGSYTYLTVTKSKIE